VSRFLLERMDDPDLIIDLHSVNHAKRVALERQRYFEHARPVTTQRLRQIGFAALGRNRQRGQADRLSPSGNSSNSLSAVAIHETGRVLRVMFQFDVVICDNTRQPLRAQAYKDAVDKWVAAIRAEEAAATPDHSVHAWDLWKAAASAEEEARDAARGRQGGVRRRAPRGRLRDLRIGEVKVPSRTLRAIIDCADQNPGRNSCQVRFLPFPR